jgi:type I restriction enzyme S subunit
MNATLLGDVLFPFPPRPEQKRIVAKIQESMKEVEHARIACEARLEAAKALPQAYLRQVFESEEAKQWERRRLGEVCEFLDSLRVPVNDTDRQRRIEGKKQTELYPYYGANGQVGWIDDYLFDEELVLLAEDGGFFGSFDRPIAYRVNGKCWVNNHAHVLRARRELINVDWLYFTLAIRPDVIQFVSGTTRMKLTQEQASIVPLPLPPLTEQKHIATELKDKITDAEKLKADIEKQLEAIKTLPQAILRKAFSGEL